MDHPTPSSRLVSGGHCSHLRHKGMYVMSVLDPNELDGGFHAESAFWCTCTMKGLGPDGEPVHVDRCAVGGGRGCCVE